MDLHVKIEIPALEKLTDYSASGIGSVAGPMLARWKAHHESKAKTIAAKANANILQIQAQAQAEARKLLIPENANVSGELNFAAQVQQRLQFQEQKRQANIASVMTKAAHELGDKLVEKEEPDHDWTARFFSDVQDVSSEEMQSLWAKVLAGEVERSGTTSIRTLSILRNLDQTTAQLFTKFCSACTFSILSKGEIIDARVPTMGGNPEQNSLSEYGLSFPALNRLNEHGLIIPSYRTSMPYAAHIGIKVGTPPVLTRSPFLFQGKYWVLSPTDNRDLEAEISEFELIGVSASISGEELARFVTIEIMDNFQKAVSHFFESKNLQMVELGKNEMQIFPW